MSLQAAPVSLLSIDALWSFRTDGSGGAALGEAWRGADFPDATWSRGQPAFQAGFGSGAEVLTAISGVETPWVTVGLRGVFRLERTNDVSLLLLRFDYEGGLIAYLNGVEVCRRGLPAGAVDPRQPGSAHGRQYGEECPMQIPAGLLREGTNVLALELHRAVSETGPAYVMPELVANFSRGPLLQNVSSNRATLTWRTPVPSAGLLRLEWEGGRSTILDDTYGTNHVVTMTNLPVHAAVRYVVEGLAGGVHFESDPVEFRTLPASGAGVVFDVVGDTGTLSLGQRQVGCVLGRSNDFVLHVGDLMYPMTLPQYADLRYFSVYRDLMAQVPFFSVLGNHDLYGGDATYLDMLELPTNQVSGTEHWYSFDAGPVHCVGLFMPLRQQFAQRPGLALEVGSPQYGWLTNDLAQTRQPWKVLFGHSPLASSGPHQSDWDQGEYDYAAWRRILEPVLQEYGVHVVFAGHDHGYERLGPYGGAMVIVNGGGGSVLYSLAARDPASALYRNIFSFVRCTVDDRSFSLQALDARGAVFDRLDLAREVAPAEAVEATVHTPNGDPGAPDGDGNFTGQTVDVPGTPLAACTAFEAHPGRLRVCVDDTWLHLGLEQVMLRPDQSLLVFLEVPGLPGVVSLAGLGDGLPDASLEGVESLDALGEHLAFGGFHPALVCVLGDEMADGNRRTAPRPLSGLDPGQGVYWLAPGFPEVEGVMVQQFNESPQGAPQWDEQQAGCMRVSLPLQQLGRPQPGSSLRLGAIVADAGALPAPSTHRLTLYSACIGGSFQWKPGDTSGVLSSQAVRLPPAPDRDDDGLDDEEERVLGTNPDSADSDADGLPDGWEVDSGLDPLLPGGEWGAAGDPDGDGAANAAEWHAGTEPRNPESVFTIRELVASHSGWALEFAAVIGRRYTLESAAGPEGPFQEVAAVQEIKALQARESFVLRPDDAGSPPARFYRVRQQSD